MYTARAALKSAAKRNNREFFRINDHSPTEAGSLERPGFGEALCVRSVVGDDRIVRDFTAGAGQALLVSISRRCGGIA